MFLQTNVLVILLKQITESFYLEIVTEADQYRYLFLPFPSLNVWTLPQKA